MADNFRGPVDSRTMLGMQGAMEAERGFARMWSAGASESVKAAYQRSAETKGAIAAENIRNRYWKKEFEQILETRVKPLQERLSIAQQVRDQTMATTTMPVERVMNEQETQERINAVSQQTPPRIQPTKGIATKEGKPTEQMVPVPAETPPNPAIGQQMGATTTEEVLALVDPISGSPVPINSARGRSIWQKAELDFWGEYSDVNKELMEVMSEYQGNPYADNYARSLIDSVIKQSNIASTGKADPLAAQEWMEGRQQFEAEQTARHQTLQAGGFQLETREAGLDVDVREAQQIVKADSSFAGLLGKTIMNKFNTGKPLTRREKFEAANAVRTYRDLQEKELERQRKQEARDKVFKIPDIDIPNPGNWQADMRADPGDPTYKQYFGEEYANFVNNQLAEVRSMPPEERGKFLLGKGASETDIAMFEEAGTITPTLRSVFEQMANDKDALVISNDLAMIRRLPELERRQPEVLIMIDRQINEAINQMKAEGRVPDEELLRADRYRTFFEITYGRPAPEIYDPRTLRRVAGILERRDLERLSRLIPEEVIEAPFEEKFNPEGSEYDYVSARAAGLGPDETGHWPSRVPSGPNEGLLLKGRNHETWDKTIAGEEAAGYEIYKGADGRYYSRKKEAEEIASTIGSPAPITGSYERYEREHLPGESETSYRFRRAREELGPLLEGIRTFIHKEPEKSPKKPATTSGRLRRRSKLKLMGLEE